MFLEGAIGNEALLLGYGFTFRENPEDKYPIQFGVVLSKLRCLSETV